MESRFWHERWTSGQLGFHQAEVNALLEKHWPSLARANDAAVFVPLCGKSLDLRWLREQGHPVIGVELSPIAVQDFFDEAGIDSRSEDFEEKAGEDRALSRRSGAGYSIYCGDFFELKRDDLALVRAVYDRASLIALPPALRVRYAQKMIEILPPDASILLITLEYDQTKMSGPPHSVPPSEVEELFGQTFKIESLASSGPQPPTAHFQQRGLDRWNEHVLLLSRKSTL